MNSISRFVVEQDFRTSFYSTRILRALQLLGELSATVAVATGSDCVKANFHRYASHLVSRYKRLPVVP
jgi:hypothetical protein